MNLIPVPDAAKRQYPDCETQVMLPPDGNMLNDRIRSADVLLDPKMPGRRMFYVADEGDFETITQFKVVYFELAILGALMPPVSLVVWPDIEKGRRDG